MPTNTTITVAIRGTIKFRSNHSGIHAGRRIRVCKLPEPRPSSSGATVPFDVIVNAFFQIQTIFSQGGGIRVVDAENCGFCYFVLFFNVYMHLVVKINVRKLCSNFFENPKHVLNSTKIISE